VAQPPIARPQAKANLYGVDCACMLGLIPEGL
jgi:hypothetical protein